MRGLGPPSGAGITDSTRRQVDRPQPPTALEAPDRPRGPRHFLQAGGRRHTPGEAPSTATALAPQSAATRLLGQLGPYRQRDPTRGTSTPAAKSSVGKQSVLVHGPNPTPASAQSLSLRDALRPGRRAPQTPSKCPSERACRANSPALSRPQQRSIHISALTADHRRASLVMSRPRFMP